MFQDRDGEKEILLGNKQLLGIFFVLVILFAVLFGAGYMVGRTSGEKKATETAVEAKSTPAEEPAAAAANGGETHAVSPDSTATAGETVPEREPARKPSPSGASNAPLGSRHSTNPVKMETAKAEKPDPTREEMERQAEADGEPTPTPAAHGTYLQVVALQRSEAEKVAKILTKKGFRAQIALKPGTQYYRVLVGPVRDAGELASTRDALKSKGFREVFVQRL
jgi:cell division protein FtsN